MNDRIKKKQFSEALRREFKKSCREDVFYYYIGLRCDKYNFTVPDFEIVFKDKQKKRARTIARYRNTYGLEIDLI